MKKEIFIHVGAGKTGTSAIQEFLFINEEKLNKQGIHIPFIGRDESNKFIFHHRLAGGKENNLDFDKTILLWKQLALENKKKILITSEIFHSRIVDKKNLNFFKTIKKIFDSYNLYIIFYIRREDQWLESAYKEWIKNGLIRDGTSLDEFILKQRVTLAEQVFLFADIFGQENIIVRPYEKKQFVGGNIFTDFFDILNIKLDEEYFYPKSNSNPRLSNDALEFKRIFNSVCSSKEESLLILPFLMRYSQNFDEKNSMLFKKETLLSTEIRKKIELKNENIYKKIATTFLHKEDGTLFYEGTDEFSTTSYHFNVEDLSKIVSFLFLNLLKEKK